MLLANATQDGQGQTAKLAAQLARTMSIAVATVSANLQHFPCHQPVASVITSGRAKCVNDAAWSQGVRMALCQIQSAPSVSVVMSGLVFTVALAA
jgi:hypothetical protein